MEKYKLILADPYIRLNYIWEKLIIAVWSTFTSFHIAVFIYQGCPIFTHFTPGYTIRWVIHGTSWVLHTFKKKYLHPFDCFRPCQVKGNMQGSPSLPSHSTTYKDVIKMGKKPTIEPTFTSLHVAIVIMEMCSILPHFAPGLSLWRIIHGAGSVLHIYKVLTDW